MNRSTIILLSIIALASAAQLSGTITTADGKTVPTVAITFTDPAGQTFNVSSAYGDGTYTVTVPDHTTLSFTAASSARKIFSSWRIPLYLPVSRDSIEVATGDLTIDFQLESAYTLVLIDYNADGSLKTFPEFSNNVWTIDEFGAPSEGHRVKISDAEYSTSTLGLIVPLSSSMISIMASTASPSVKGYAISADNSGKGYGSAEQGGVIVYLNKETALAAMTRVNEKNSRANYPPVATTTVEQNQNRAFTFQMSNPDVVELSHDIIDDNTAAEDALEAARAEKYTGIFRNNNVTVRVSDQSGNVPEGVTLTLDMSSRDYNFGVYASPFNYNETTAWTMLREIGINTATVDFWWSTISTASTLEDESVLKEKIEKLLSMGFKLRATGLFQPTSSELPLYAKSGNVDEFAEALRSHVTSLVSTYCQKFDMIEVSTDLNALGSRLGFNASEIVHLQRVSLDAIQKAAPGVRTSISTSNEYAPTEDSWNVPLAYYKFSRQWISAGLSVDQIGQEIYHGVSSPAHTVGDLSDLLDAVSTLGRPVRVSRFNVPSSVEDKGKYLEKFYAVAFAKKNVKEITWGDIVSDGATVGLFDTDMSPTPLFYSLKNTIERLTSASPIYIGVDGQATTSRVAGDYILSAKKDGETLSFIRMRLDEGRKSRVSVIYNESEKSATFQMDSLASPVVNNPAPAPAPAPMGDGSQNRPDSSTSLAGWAIFLIAFSTIVFAASAVALVVFAVIKRRRNNAPSTTSLDLAAGDRPDTSTVTLEDSPKNQEIIPEKWTEGPLCIEVPLDASEHEDDENHTDTDMTSSEESEEDVPLDEEEGMTSSGSSDEEHL